MRKLNPVSWVAVILVIIGGLNYGIVGLFGVNVLGFILGAGLLERIIYVLIGISAIWLIIELARCSKCCCKSGSCKCCTPSSVENPEIKKGL